ncbi:hypothetical protein HN51_026325 [Arachis hypogaea]|uniref:VQ domain-containing protein n=1 Tax=Arachis hypogaea TaxID=3818 RepID=A0A445CHH1_ARAHY|nr:VQ motif-containing protein [Arachis hypogaea]RYR50379.1 hypothetical protein Ahy_A07g036972 [Arachis hypogaea]
MSGYGSGSNKGPVKVVIINTQYVETDATSFKSVVQKLTGKDSSDDYGKPRLDKLRDHHHHHHQRKNYYNNNNNNNNHVHVPDSSSSAGNNNNNGFVNQFLIRDMSFKEFDRLFSQMPPINDILSE